jgi:hypothetical protein
MKLPRTNIGLAGSPPSKGGISGAGGYVLKRPSFREYYTGKKRPIKEDEEEEEKKEMSPLAKTAAALGISIAAIMALSPTAREKAMKLVGIEDNIADYESWVDEFGNAKQQPSGPTPSGIPPLPGLGQ